MTRVIFCTPIKANLCTRTFKVLAMRYARFFSFLAILIFQSTIHSQTLGENLSGSWLEFSGTGKIHNEWSIPLAGILRHHDVFDMYDFSFLRTGVSYHLNDMTTLTGGVAYVNSKSYSELEAHPVTTQYWLYEEFTLKSKFGKNRFSHRWRLENRWIKNKGKTHFNNRFRYRLQFDRPIYGRTFIKSNNEIFISLDGHWFNQNRFYIGIGRELSPNLRVDIGYLKNHFRNSHLDAISMGLTFSTNFMRNDVAYIEK